MINYLCSSILGFVFGCLFMNWLVARLIDEQQKEIE